MVDAEMRTLKERSQLATSPSPDRIHRVYVDVALTYDGVADRIVGSPALAGDQSIRTVRHRNDNDDRCWSIERSIYG